MSVPAEGPAARVLVVEDDVRMAKLLHRGLSQTGWVVDIAADVVAAQGYVASSTYDAVVCDIGLPGRSGLDWCRELRTAGIWVPVLMLTARSAVEDRVEGLDAGADDYLVKPFAFTELTARLRALVRRGEAERPRTLSVGPVQIDLNRHEATAHGKPLELSAREFALMEFFLRRPGYVRTRTEILDHVWEYSYDGLSNVVDVYVGYLRRKLDAAGVGSFITTVRGVGYRCTDGGADA